MPNPTPNTRYTGPIRHQRCPACHNTATIFKETTTYPYTVDDALAGTSPLSSLLFPRRRIRLRCAQCNCLFPARWHPAVRLLAQSFALAAIGAAALWAYPNRAQFWAWLLSQWRTDPLICLVVGAVGATALLVILIVAAYPRPAAKPKVPDQLPSSTLSTRPPPTP